MKVLPRCLAMTAAFFAFLATGCHARYEKQTVYVVFPKDRDEVRALLVYEGLHVHHDPNFKGDEVQAAKREVGDFITKEEFCLLGGWPFCFTLAPEKDDGPETREEKAFLRKHLTVDIGAFYTRADGKLCGYQYVTVREASKFVAGLNEKISRAILKEEPGESKEFDRESQALIRRAAREGHAWLKLQPGRLTADVPMTGASARRIKRELLDIDRLRDLEDLRSAPIKPSRPLLESFPTRGASCSWCDAMPCSWRIIPGRSSSAATASWFPSGSGRANRFASSRPRNPTSQPRRMPNWPNGCARWRSNFART